MLKSRNDARIAPAAGWILLGLFLAAVAGFFVARVAVLSYLGSRDFQQMLSRKTSEFLRVRGEFLPVRVNGTALYSDGFRGEGGAVLKSISADQIRTDVELAGVLEGEWRISELTAQRVDLTIGPREAEPAAPPRPAAGAASGPGGPGWLPSRVGLSLVKAGELNLRWHDSSGNAGSLLQTRVVAEKHGSEGWAIRGESGTLRLGTAPELAVDAFDLRHRGETLYVTNALLHPTADSSVKVSGEIGDRTGLRVTLHKVPAAPHLPEDWRARLSGDLHGDVDVLAEPGGKRTMSGSVRLTNGELRALPILDQIAVFTRTERFRRLALGRAEAELTSVGGRIDVTRFVAESEGLLKVEGRCVIERGQIDGNFVVGVTAASLQWLPGAQERVFTERRDGYLWTTMRVSGPVDQPKEDLSARLAIAAGGAVIEGMEGTVRDAAETLLDLAVPLLR